MAEKIAFASWDFIEPICAEHETALEIGEIRRQPFYVCSNDGCNTKIPAYVYEKILEDTVSKLNAGAVALGTKWRKKYLGKNYEMKLVVLVNGRRTKVSVRCFG